MSYHHGREAFAADVACRSLTERRIAVAILPVPAFPVTVISCRLIPAQRLPDAALTFEKMALNGMLKRIAKLGLLLLMGMSMRADAGWLGFGGDSWKEEALQYDGSKMIVERSQTRGGSHEIGQPPPVKEHTISFTLPGTSKTIKWTSEYSEDIGRANFDLLALHVLNGTPYIVTSPNLCLSYNKWGRPNPPYVLFKYDGKAWQRIPLSELPAEFKTINVAADTLGDEDRLVDLGFVSAEKIKELNGEFKQPEFKTILRKPLTNEWCATWKLTNPKAPLPMKPLNEQQKEQ